MKGCFYGSSTLYSTQGRSSRRVTNPLCGARARRSFMPAMHWPDDVGSLLACTQPVTDRLASAMAGLFIAHIIVTSCDVQWLTVHALHDVIPLHQYMYKTWVIKQNLLPIVVVTITHEICRYRLLHSCSRYTQCGQLLDIHFLAYGRGPRYCRHGAVAAAG